VRWRFLVVGTLEGGRWRRFIRVVRGVRVVRGALKVIVIVNLANG